MLKYFFLIVIFVLLGGILSAQSFISGKIRDAKTLEPLPFANIYINNTTIGVAANQVGEYLLKGVPIGINEVVFSFVGYQTYSTKVRSNNGETLLLNIKLKQSGKELDNVSVNSTRDKEWEKRYRRFERVFLGSTKNAAHSKILNPWAIDLSENIQPGKRELIAKSAEPIEIENLVLGYRIFYDLKTFTSTNSYFKFSGNIFFNEINTTDSAQAARWAKSRVNAYRGSTRHFFKSVLDNRVKEEGFRVFAYKSGFEKNAVRSTVFSDDLDRVLTAYNPSGFFLPGRYPGEFRVTLKPILEIHYLNSITAFRTYRDIEVPVAGMELTSGYVEVNKAGVILNPSALITSGYMSDSRVADLLPYDYVPGEGGDFVSLKPVSKVTVNLDRLQEKIYLHTDKSYYYPGEVVWFKGYMKYNYPEKLDSLSAVLYVDLISPDRKVLQTKMFQVDSGFVIGDILIPGSFEKGNYVLRAYTNWMRNYPANNFFIKPLPIIGFYENLETVVEKPTKDLSKYQIEIKPDKESYQVRDSISLYIAIKDDYENPISANLSISVTDTDQVISLSQETIAERFSKIDTAANSMNITGKSYPVEHGISISGQFRNKKGRPEVMKIQIIQGDFEDMTNVNTDEQGNFSTNGFQFNDSLEFALRATDVDGRSYGKITILPREYPAVPDSLPVLKLPFRKTEFKNRQIQRYDESGSVRILKEVIITAPKIEEKRKFTQYGTADYSISTDVLENANSMNLIYAIQSRVPGLRLILINGTYYILLGGISGFGGGAAMEPLLVIDGQPYNGSGGLEGDGIISGIDQLTPSNILRIDVFKYGSASAFGARGANGVIAVYTKNGLPLKEEVKGYDKTLFQLVTLGGYTVPRKFKSPSYGGLLKESEVPDYRSTIHWQPSVSTNPQTGEVSISFYAADLETKYRIVVEGLTSMGEPIRAEYFIQILK